MKTVLAIISFAVAVNNTWADDFKPSTESIARAEIALQGVHAEATGFAPWRDRKLVLNIDANANMFSNAVSRRELNGFPPLVIIRTAACQFN